MSTRFEPKPSNALKDKITVYFTPSEEPICGVNVAKLKEIIAANQDDFADWPRWEVLEFSKAKGAGLKAIGVNFFQFFVTWMEEDDYKTLWKESRVNELPLQFPKFQKHFKDFHELLIKGGQMLDGMPIQVTSEKIREAKGQERGLTKDIMGQSAAVVSCVCH